MGRRSEIDILTSFVSDEPQTAAQIVVATGLPRSTVFRALRQLVGSGLLQQDPRLKRYSLGLEVVRLGGIARRQLDPGESLTPPLLDLAAKTNETVTFSVPEVPWRLCVYVIEAPSELRSVAQAGSRYALHVGGSSSAILAHLPQEIAESVLRFHGVEAEEIPAHMAQLESVREAGLAVSVGQRVPGASSVAAPVFLGATIFGSVAVAGPRDRLAERFDEIKPLVARTGVALSARVAAHDSVTRSPAD
jgi:DNA-binding IclR family transcriptional regulator